MNEGNDELGQQWYDQKSSIMVELLGEEHDEVLHALIPYSIGGGLDFYYYPNSSLGTAVATKELSELPGEGSSNDAFECFELVMFTRHSIDCDDVNNAETKFGKVDARIRAILNCIAPYSAQAILNPGDTCEFPEDMQYVGGGCLIFDAYPNCPDEEPAPFGLMCVIEIFPSEMAFAREHGSEDLFEKLKAKGHYPYSDMDRKPVV